jgi:hypothetical protein
LDRAIKRGLVAMVKVRERVACAPVTTSARPGPT